jgi:hypothetical protein
VKKKKENAAQARPDELTSKQALVMWKLVLVGDGQLLSRFTPQLTTREVEGLVRAGFCAVEVGRGGRGKRLRLTDGGWRWANRGFAVKVSQSKVAAPVLDALLTKVGAYLSVHGLALDDLLRPRRPAPQPLAIAETSIEERIRAAYLRASGGGFHEHVRLARLRAELQGEAAGTVDVALLEMQQRGGTVLYPIDDPQALGPEDRAAALFVAGARRDLVCIER